jgi:hypothetical protein
MVFFGSIFCRTLLVFYLTPLLLDHKDQLVLLLQSSLYPTLYVENLYHKLCLQVIGMSFIHGLW